MATKKQKQDAIQEVFDGVWEYEFGGDDFTLPVKLAFVDAVIAASQARGLTADRDVVMAMCAEQIEWDLDELRAADAAQRKHKEGSQAARGTSAEIDALAVLRPQKSESNGRFGLTFSDAAAQTLAEAWPRLDPVSFGKKIFGGIKDLRIGNFGALSCLSGLEAATDATRIELRVTPDCDLAPLGKLQKLQTLVLQGKLDGYAPLGNLPKLTTLQIAANEKGLTELAAVPKLRVLELIVAETVRVSGLLALRSLNLLILLAGTRKLDADLVDTMAALAKRKVHLKLAAHEGWPSKLKLANMREVPGYVQINSP